jgi:RHS repeat-associated protein
MDDQANIISYQDYYPYGGTSLIAGNSASASLAKEVSIKEYRYTGKECDDSTGLYYYGARYYAPWLGRWASCDPKGIVGGINLYAYTEDNPIRLNDPSGTQGLEPEINQSSEDLPNVRTAIADAMRRSVTTDTQSAPDNYVDPQQPNQNYLNWTNSLAPVTLGSFESETFFQVSRSVTHGGRYSNSSTGYSLGAAGRYGVAEIDRAKVDVGILLGGTSAISDSTSRGWQGGVLVHIAFPKLAFFGSFNLTKPISDMPQPLSPSGSVNLLL